MNSRYNVTTNIWNHSKRGSPVSIIPLEAYYDHESEPKAPAKPKRRTRKPKCPELSDDFARSPKPTKARRKPAAKAKTSATTAQPKKNHKKKREEKEEAMGTVADSSSAPSNNAAAMLKGLQLAAILQTNQMEHDKKTQQSKAKAL